MAVIKWAGVGIVVFLVAMFLAYAWAMIPT